MDRRSLLRTGMTVGAGAVAGCLGGGSSSPAYETGFESGMEGWETDAGIGPEVDLEEFEWEIGASEEQAAAGEQSLRIWNEGDYDDGTCWAVHPMPVESGQTYTATVSAQFWSESESFNTIRHAVMRLAAEKPTAEADFPDPGQNTTELGETPYGGLREPLWLADGWREYTFEWTTPKLSTDELYVALGTSVVWETAATHYVDDVTVELEPR
ncbi:hypothetical protein [Haloparvum sp. PAK95]|uniref:hypothetical protein n=1 Tax=Haloparvum sp. PAK95 TaxID=3418962 RepID=UPI003D2F26CB